ncbi:sugar phosphate isomerase/epimerase family protein [Pseudactinotalea sp. Z1748]|uniref:sugar phosphate isomerase/epimerase family protein n=1 Tax=Pseudactinotalea sp. Z1748 TaxID=3413027 RepID=UPI003C7E8364
MSTATVSIATICFDGFGDEDFHRTFTHAKQVGVRQIEFNAWYARNLTPAGLDSVVSRCHAHDLTPASLQISPFAPGPDAPDLAREAARWMWLLEAAERLGVRVIKATGSRRGQRGGLERLIDLLALIGPIAEQRNLTISVENHFNNVIEHPQDYRDLFDAVQTPAVGMCLDTGHFLASGHDLVAIVEEFAGRIVQVDLKDCAAPGAATFVRFGAGAVDFDAVLSRILATGFDGYVVIELPLIEEDTMLADLRAGAEIAARYLPLSDSDLER